MLFSLLYRHGIPWLTLVLLANDTDIARVNQTQRGHTHCIYADSAWQETRREIAQKNNKSFAKKEAEITVKEEIGILLRFEIAELTD
jgi:hypothetical protein